MAARSTFRRMSLRAACALLVMSGIPETRGESRSATTTPPPPPRPRPVGRGDQAAIVQFKLYTAELDNEAAQAIPLSRRRPSLVIEGRRQGTSGFAQEIRISSPGGGTAVMSSPATVQVIAKEVNCGVGGAPVSVALDYSTNGGQSWTPMFSGQAVAVGNSEVLSLTNQMETLRFRARTLSCAGLTAESIDPNRGMILQAGQNWACMQSAKGVQAGYSGQPNLATLLAPYVDSQSGNVTVNANQVLVPFEFAPFGDTADFQDLVLLVTTSNPITEGETVEFDWIGNDETTTQNMGAVYSSQGGIGFGSPGTVFTISGCSNRRVKMLRAVVLGTPWEVQPPPLTQWHYHLKLWQGAQSYFNAGGHPNSAYKTVTLGLPTNDEPYIPPPCNGQLEYLCPWTYSFIQVPEASFADWVPLYEFKWDLTEAVAEPLILPPGEWMAVLVATNTGQNNSGLWMSGSNALGAFTGAFAADDMQPAMWNVDRDWFPNWPMEIRTLTVP